MVRLLFLLVETQLIASLPSNTQHPIPRFNNSTIKQKKHYLCAQLLLTNNHSNKMKKSVFFLVLPVVLVWSACSIFSLKFEQRDLTITNLDGKTVPIRV